LKILLINPKIKNSEGFIQERIIDSLHKRSGTNIYNCPPLSLYHLASFMKDDELVIIDEAIGERIPSLSRFDIVMVSSSTVQAERAREIGFECKKKGIVSVIGGIHSTVEPEFFSESYDYIFSGEVDDIFGEFLGKMREKRDSQRLWKGETGSELKTFPISYELIDGEKYDFIPIQISRGCPNGCKYCASSNLFGRRIRRKKIEVVRDELESIKKNHGGKLVYITDDNFTKLGDFALEVISILNDLGLRYICYGDVSIIDDERIIEGLSGNCVKLLVGFDSLEGKNLKFYAPYKLKYLDRYVEFVRRIQGRGIGVFGSFIVGFDFDDEFFYGKIVDFLEETLLAEICVSILVPMPGSAVREKLKEEGRILDIPYSKYDGSHLVFSGDLSEKQLIEGIEKVLKSYLSPKLMKKRGGFFKEVFRRKI